MDVSIVAFLGLLLAVALLRLAELRISKRHQREMRARGAVFGLLSGTYAVLRRISNYTVSDRLIV